MAVIKRRITSDKKKRELVSDTKVTIHYSLRP